MTYKFLQMLVICELCSWLSSMAAVPILMRKNNGDDQTDTFKAGNPLTDEKFRSEPEFDDFIPWDKQNPELLEGDIMTPESKNAILNSKGLWPKATIPYVISASYTCEQRQIIAFAMNEYHTKTCIRFVPRTSETNYIKITKSGHGCSSFVGRIGGGQNVSLDDGCVLSRAPGVVVHELMHTAGFWHEHMRPDRDAYVFINYTNLNLHYRGNFDRLSTTQVTTLGLSYDYGSVMHYPKEAFAIDPSVPVIKPLFGNPILGQRAAFSTLDIRKLNKLYNCTSVSPSL